MSIKDQPEFEAPETGESAPTAATTTTTATTTTANVNTKKENTMNTTTAVSAKTANTAVATPRTMSLAFTEFKDIIDIPTVSALSIATPRITAEQGSLYSNRTEDLGKIIRVQLVSFNHRFLISTGTDDKEAVEHLRTSYDGVTLESDGSSVADYVESLKAMGYPSPKVNPYTDMWAFVVWSEKKGDIPVEERALTMIQLSKTSAGNWAAFSVSRGLLEKAGAAALDTIEIHAEARTSGSNKFTNMSFHAPKV